MKELAKRAVACERWQPIETAPKDGTAILAWCEHAADLCYRSDDSTLTEYASHVEAYGKHVDDGCNIVAWYDAYNEPEYAGGPTYTVPGGWFLIDLWLETPANPTHWMSLPDGPEKVKK